MEHVTKEFGWRLTSRLSKGGEANLSSRSVSFEEIFGELTEPFPNRLRRFLVIFQALVGW